MIPTFFPKPVVHLKTDSRETTQSLQVDAWNGGRKTVRYVLENGDMKGIRSCIYTQHSLWVAIIGSLGQVRTLGNVIKNFEKIVTSGDFWRIYVR